MESHSTRGEYLEANQGRIDQLAKLIEARISEPLGPDALIMQDGMHGRPYFVLGEFGPADVEGIAQTNEPELMAENLNRKTLDAAEITIQNLFASTQMAHLADLIREQEERPEGPEPGFAEATADSTDLSYESASQRESNFGQFDLQGTEVNIDVTVTQLMGLEEHRTATLFGIELSDNGAKTQIYITRLGEDRYVSIAKNIYPESDPFRQRYRETLGAMDPEIFFVISGRLEEEDINPILNDKWLDLVPTALRVEAEALLDEAKERGLAARQGHEFTVDHSADLPSVDELDELTALLSDD